MKQNNDLQAFEIHLNLRLISSQGNLDNGIIILMRKYILALAGVALLPLFGYLISKSKPRDKKGSKKYYVGVELGGTNFNIAVSQPVLSQTGDIIDFKIVRRKNGQTFHGPEQALAEIRTFIESTL